jgi:hypothetical protein
MIEQSSGDRMADHGRRARYYPHATRAMLSADVAHRHVAMHHVLTPLAAYGKPSHDSPAKMVCQSNRERDDRKGRSGSATCRKYG